MASWGSYVFELCRINANQGLTAEIDWNYTSWSRRCRKILIGLVVRGAKTVVVRGKNRILTRNRKKPEMTVPISNRILTRNRKKPEMTVPISSPQGLDAAFLVRRASCSAMRYQDSTAARQKEKPLAPLQSPCRWQLVVFALLIIGAAFFLDIP